jgi:hypothetical protein
LAPLALIIGIAVLLLLPWGGASGIGEVQVSLNGLSRPAAWTVLWSLAATALAAAGVRREVSSPAWLVGAVSVGLAVTRFPVALLGLLLLSAVLLPRLSAGAAASGWARTLVIGAGAGTAMVAAGLVGRQHGDEVIATVLVVGFLAAAGAAPFGLHLTRWLDQADPEVGAVVAAAFPACVLAAFVASTQEHVAGEVRVRCAAGTVTVTGRRARRSLYSVSLATYDREGDTFDHGAARGFIELFGLPLRNQARVQGALEDLAPLSLPRQVRRAD